MKTDPCVCGTSPVCTLKTGRDERVVSIKCESCGKEIITSGPTSEPERTTLQRACDLWNENMKKLSGRVEDLPGDPMLRELMGLIADVNPVEIVTQAIGQNLPAWCNQWRMKAAMLVGFLDEKLKQSKSD